jgi:hypothetical protein
VHGHCVSNFAHLRLFVVPLAHPAPRHAHDVVRPVVVSKAAQNSGHHGGGNNTHGNNNGHGKHGKH